MFEHRSTGTKRSVHGLRQATSRPRRSYRGLSVEGLEDRTAPASQIFGGLEFLTSGAFSVSNNVVMSSSPVEVGLAPASGGTFTPLMLFQSGVQFTRTDTSGTFMTPPAGGLGGAVSAFAGGIVVPLLDAHSHTFEAPALLSSALDHLPSSDVNQADLPVAGGDLSVTGLGISGTGLAVQGNLSLPSLPGLTLPVSGNNYVGLTNLGVALTGLADTIAGLTSFTEDGLDFTVSGLLANYSSAANAFDIRGNAAVTVAGNTLSLTLGSVSAPGLVIENGAFASVDAEVNSNIVLGGMTLTAQDLVLQATAGSNLDFAGDVGLELDAGGTMQALNLSLGSTGPGGVVTNPGLVISLSTGNFVSLSAVVNGNLNLGGLQVSSNNLAIDYNAANESFEVAGTVSYGTDGSPVNFSMGGSGAAGLAMIETALAEFNAWAGSNNNAVDALIAVTDDLAAFLGSL